MRYLIVTSQRDFTFIVSPAQSDVAVTLHGFAPGFPPLIEQFLNGFYRETLLTPCQIFLHITIYTSYPHG